MKKQRIDDRGQVFTIEGVVSAIILVVALSYILSSITIVSPQMEKSTSVKLTIQAQDLLNMMASENMPKQHMSDLKNWTEKWNGNEPAGAESVSASEQSIQEMNDTISLLLPRNVAFNAYIYYYDDAGQPVSKTLIYHGEPVDNAGTATKLVVLSKNDSVNFDDTGKSAYWQSMKMPKVAEIKLVLWST